MSHLQRLIGAAALLLLLAVTAAAAAAHRPPRYRTAAARDPTKLNVHIVCHSHDDSGWLKTVDQYYWGANNTIQVAGVQYILDTVVQALAANPDRKFIYSEMSFFERWWRQQDEDTRALVTRLVQDGQLEFVNGGYVQHDEATAHYVGMIDQTTRGHSFLKRTFGATPRVGWQIDPFGHSSTQAGLLSAHVGFDALFFGRADYQDMEYRKRIQAMELVWRGSASLQDADIFTGNFASGNYGPPEGFAYEWACPPIMDDPHLDEYNVQERVDAFVEQCHVLANVTRGNDIMLTIGSDFQFANAHLQYKNLDKLIHYANQDGRLNAFYSTPSTYAAAKHGYDTKWPLKQDDFFPYADFPHSYWTGYFTSRAASKGFIRTATSYLQAARQLEAFMGLAEVDDGGPTTDALEEAVSLLQHHDAVTGTEKEHVASDYHRRLAKGLTEAQALVNSALERLIRGQTRPGGSSTLSGDASKEPAAAAQNVLAAAKQDDTAHLAASQRRMQASGSSGSAAAGSNPVDMPVPLHSCNWVNVSACNTTVRLSAAGKGVLVAAYNPLAWSREVPLRVPLNASKTCAWKVTGPEGEEVASQLVGVAPGTWCLQQLLAGVNATCPATYGDAELAFIARLPPLGYSTFYLEPQADASCKPSSSSSNCDAQRTCGGGLGSTSSTAKASGSVSKGDRYEKLDNGLVTLEFDTETGLLARITANGISASLSTGFAWYNSSTDAEQPSGAYIFRPNGSYPLPEEEPSAGSWWQCLWGGASVGSCGKGGKPTVQLEIVRGETVSEARQAFAGWATLVTRLHRGQSHVEVEWTVGPIPFKDGLGREVVLQYTSDLGSGDEFWTDANGREMIRRIRDFRPSWELNLTELIASNFYPLTAAMYIQDDERQLALLTERAQAGASLRSGQMEVMVHRRTMEDDFRGVAEPLNETACGCTQCDCPGLVVRGRHWLLLAPRNEAARPRRTLQQELNDPPVLAFGAIPRGVGSHGGSEGSVEGRTGLRRTWSLSEGHIMHSNVHLLTLKDTGSSYLVRLAHLYQEGEDPALAQPVTENLNAVLQLLEYSAIEELSLSGNQRRSDMLRRRLRFKAGDSLTNSTWLEGSMGGGAKGRGAGSSASSAASAAGVEIIDCRSGCRNGELLVTLKPMEVRTFNLLYKPY